MRKLKIAGCTIIGIFSFLLVGCILLVQCTPKPVNYLTRKGFSGGEEGVVYGLHPEYAQMKERVRIYQNHPYSSAYENASYDLYVPSDDTKSYPILLWVHGGAFVGGDKKDISTFATALASQGYVILCMNYGLAPEYQYPVPLQQVIELSEEIPAMAKQYPMDISQIFIGGDSAGAHIALQFVLTQVNEEYRAKLMEKQVLSPDVIKGYLSFCGLLDILRYDETDSSFSNFLYAQSAWGYFNEKDWKQAAKIQDADLLPYLTRSLPPVYLTDGDKDSFLPQAKRVKQILLNEQVEVSDCLWEDGEHPHEYQFHLDQEAGLENFQRVLEFLKTQSIK